MGTPTREQIVAEARTWMGTPWQHQGHLKSVGVDCGGLVRGVAFALGIWPKDYSGHHLAKKWAGYARNPNEQFNLATACVDFMQQIPTDEMQAGDVVLMRFGAAEPRHIGILGNYAHGGLSLIHSVLNLHVHEHRLDEKWRRRIVAAYSLLPTDLPKPQHGKPGSGCCKGCR